MNAFSSTAMVALATLTLAASAFSSSANESAPEPAATGRDLLSENPRLRQLLAEANRSGGPAEVQQLADAGVDASVIQKYVETSSRRYDLDADQIIKLHERGVTSGVIAAMIRKKGNAETPAPAASPAPAPTPAAPIVVQSEAPASGPVNAVIYVPNSPRPVRYPDRPFYAGYPYAGWSPAYYGGYGYGGYYPGYCYRPGYWNYRPAWSYDFRFYGCW